MCGKEFEYREGQQTGRFCSQGCFNIYQNKRIKTKCDLCNKEIEVKQCDFNKYKYHFCSKKCQIKWQQSKKVRHKCPICGKIFYSPKSSHRITCSERCKAIFNNQKQSNKNGLNGLELMGRQILERIGLTKDKDFKEQYLIEGKFLVDVYIPSKKIVIQWDGDYWHNLQKVKARDKSQNNYLKKCGYKVLRFWEINIKNNPNKVGREIYENLQD